MFKRCLSAALALCMLLTFMPTAAFAEDAITPATGISTPETAPALTAAQAFADAVAAATAQKDAIIAAANAYKDAYAAALAAEGEDATTAADAALQEAEGAFYALFDSAALLDSYDGLTADEQAAVADAKAALDALTAETDAILDAGDAAEDGVATYAEPSTEITDAATLADVLNTTQAGTCTVSGNTVTLQSDVKTTTSLNITGGTIILDLNGKTINRGLTSTANNGNVIRLSGTANLTLNDSSADLGKITGGYCLDVYGGGIYQNGGTLTINGGQITGNKSGSNWGGGIHLESGELTINGGAITKNSSVNSGGGISQWGGTLTINGGQITDNSAFPVGPGSAGNGGGICLWAGTLNITGGSIGKNNARQGGGIYLQNGTLNITGGSITQNTATAHLYYSGDGGGIYKAAGTLTVGGTATVTGNTVSDAGNNIYLTTGQKVLVSTDKEPAAGAKFGITTASAPGTAGVALTGTNSADYSSYFTSDSENYAIQNINNVVKLTAPPLTVENGTKDTDYTYKDGVLTVIKDTALTIKNTDPTTATTDHIVVAKDTPANITLAGVNISTGTGSAFDIDTTSTVNLTVTGTNTLTSQSGVAGLHLPEGASLTITAGSAGTLNANGGDYSAGIGGNAGSLDYPGTAGESSGTFIIEANSGVIVNATGGFNGNGIGGGASRNKAGGNGDTITINGGTVNATCKYNGTAIGGGYSDNNTGGVGGTITINGGTVTATRSGNPTNTNSDLIGGGGLGTLVGSAGTIKITGGTVTAVNSNGTGIGGNGGSVEITGGTVTASGANGGSGIGAGASGTVTITGGNISASSVTNPKNGSDTLVYKATFTEPTENKDKVFAVTKANGADYSYDLSKSTAIDGAWYVYLPAGAAEGTYDATAIYMATVTNDGNAKFALPAARWGVVGENGAEPTAWFYGSMKQAMDYANTYVQGETKYIQLQQDVTQDSHFKDNKSPLNFSVNANAILDLNGHTIDRGLTVATANGEVIYNMGTLTIKDSSDLDVTKQGKITGGNNSDDGGGIYSTGTLTVTGGQITGNTSAGGGGGIAQNSGTLTITGGSITKNTAYQGGGLNQDAGTAEISNCEISGNTLTSIGGGGGIYSNGTMTLTDCTITGNTSGKNGGGIYSAKKLTVNGGSITGNKATSQGGGIFEYSGAAEISNSTISGNTAATGGGIFQGGGTLTVAGGQITGNIANSQGGGIYCYGSLTVSGTAAVTGNTKGTGTAAPASNIYLSNDKPITANALETGAALGITTSTNPTKESPVAITAAGSVDVSGYFSSDNTAYGVKNGAENAVQLIVIDRTITVDTTTAAFTDAPYGYTQPDAVTITVENTGNVDTGAITLALGGTNASDFTLNAASLASLAAGGNATFTVQPNAGLGVGAYAATITVSAADYTAQTVNVRFTVKQATPATPDKPALDRTFFNSISVSPILGQKYICLPATAAAPMAGVGTWQDHGTFTGLTRNTAYKIYTYIPAANASYNDSAVSAPLEVTTSKEIIRYIAPQNNITLDTYCATEAEALAALQKVMPSIAGVDETVGSPNLNINITWSISGYVSTPGAVNKNVTWTITAPDGYEFSSGNGIDSGTITLTNAAAISVDNKGSAETVTYSERLRVDVSEMFTLDAHAGAPSYSIDANQTTGGYTFDGTILTVTKAGQFYINLTTAAQGAYAEGTATAIVTVNKATPTLGFEFPNETYDGQPVSDPTNVTTNSTGKITITYLDEDNKEISAPTDAGNYRVKATLNADDNYTGTSIKVFFKISKRPATLGWTDTTIIYDGKAHAPTATVTNLVGKDTCTVTVDGAQTNAGSYTATATALGNPNYRLSTATTQAFTIAAKELTADMVSNPVDVTYTGAAQEPAVTVTDSTAPITADDYDIKYNDNTNAGTATVTVTAKGNYTGTVTKTFEVTAKTLTDAMVSAPADVTYTGAAQQPAVTVKDGTAPITADDYDIACTNNTNVGIATMTVTAKGNYTGTVTKTFEVMAKILDNTMITVAPNLSYDANAKKPVTVTDGTALKDSDYDIDYQNNVNAGTGSYMVTAKGNYIGIVSGTFTIAQREATVSFVGGPIFYYDGKEHCYTVTVGNLVGTATAMDECTATFTGARTEVGDNYLVEVTGLSNPNYKLPDSQYCRSLFHIKYLPAPAEPYTLAGTQGTNDWYTSDVTLKPADGYTVSTTLGSGYGESITLDASTPDGCKIYLQNADGQMTDGIPVSIKIDKAAPTGTIAVGTSSWNKFLNTVTFGLFFKETKAVTVTPGTQLSGVTVEMLKSETLYTDATIAGETNWASGSTLNVDPNFKGYVYAKLTSGAGLVSYLNTDGVVLYTDAAADTATLTYTKTTKTDAAAAVKLNGNTVNTVSMDGTTLTDTQYSVSGSTITLNGDHLDTLAAGDHTVTVSYNPMGLAYKEAEGNAAPATTTIALTVAKATLTPTATANSKTYDGTTAATGSIALAGAATGDEPTATAAAYAFADEKVGTGKPVTATGIVLDGTWGDTYVLAADTAATTADITKRPAAPLTDSGVTYNVAAQTVTGLGDIYEYSLDGGTTWQTTDKNVSFAPGAVLVRKKATETDEPSQAQTVGTIAKPAAAPTLTIDYVGEQTAEPLPDGYEYTTDPTGQTGWTSAGGSKLTLAPGKTYLIRKAATADAVAGAAQTLTVPTRPTAPVAPTLAGSTDTTLTIAGTVPKQEYSVDGKTWLPGTGDLLTFTGLVPEKEYHVYTRIPAANGSSPAFESEIADIAVKTSSKPTPTATVVPDTGDTHGDIGPAKANGTWGKDESSAAADSAKLAASRIPATSDSLPMIPLLILVLASGTAIVLLVYLRRKNSSRK